MREWNESEFLARFLFGAVLFLFAAFMLIPTEAQQYPAISQDPPTQWTHQESLNYFWDSRTKLCFASTTFTVTGGVHITSFTNVPCTDEVWTEINKGRK